jgi:hypothetical protein
MGWKETPTTILLPGEVLRVGHEEDVFVADVNERDKNRLDGAPRCRCSDEASDEIDPQQQAEHGRRGHDPECEHWPAKEGADRYEQQPPVAAAEQPPECSFGRWR